MTVLALKLLLAPLLVVASSLAGRRWGPRLAGILVVLPIVAGPILLILYLDHGSEFAANAARAATLGIVPLAAFALIFVATDRVCSVSGSGAYRCVGALSNCPERGMRLHRGAVWSRRRSCITARHRAWAGWLCAVLLSGCCSDQQDECHGSVQSGNSGRSNLRGHPGHAELMIRPGAPRSQQQRSRLGSNP